MVFYADLRSLRKHERIQDDRCQDWQSETGVSYGVVMTVRDSILFGWERSMKRLRLELRHWCYAFWRAASSKKGVAALEIKRHCQISYKSSLFLMNRIRFAITPDAKALKLTGIVECDETYIGGKPRPGDGKAHKRGRGTSKTPVFATVDRKAKSAVALWSTLLVNAASRHQR